MGRPKFLTRDGLLVAECYTRIVRNDKGEEYYEFEDSHINKPNVRIPSDATWRLNNENAFYIEYRSNCSSNIKLYHQRRTVSYADYKVGMWYISVCDVIMEYRGQQIERNPIGKATDYL